MDKKELIEALAKDKYKRMGYLTKWEDADTDMMVYCYGLATADVEWFIPYLSGKGVGVIDFKCKTAEKFSCSECGDNCHRWKFLPLSEALKEGTND